MRKYFLFLVLIGALASCSDSDDNIVSGCGVNNPAKDLQWLKTEIDRRNENPTEDMKYCYILHAEYDGEAVFVYQDCNPLINKIIPVFNCDGTIINGPNNPITFDELQNQKIIWKPNDFECQL